MAKDIEEFLRAAAARRRETQASPPPPAAPGPTPAKTPTARQKKQPPRTAPLVSEVEVEVVTQKRESVAQHVAQHLDTSRLKQSADKLGAEVGKADDLLESRLHKTFDHQVGTMTRAPGEVTSIPPSGSGRRVEHPLKSMLASPQGMRQAIIASEILKRPDWDSYE